ncbi:MAG: helix-turn-helix domain-containing protein [Candidatus Omnitrophica bacterium]|nr:helix-turn-helix domain-containing protein [Candidatus Omnitrophota bacterium]MBD3268719.1 helix-turn-helix domain-containing protein [Candidatus Omnitrophota bacterium]
MAKRKEEDKFLDVNATMQGSLVFSDPVNLKINGKFEGTLNTKGNLVIGEDAQVTANIEGENIMIAGSVKGKIRASGLFKLTSTASVTADVQTPRISVEEGASFNGKCTMAVGKISLEELSDYLSIEGEKIKEWVESGKIPAEREGDRLVFDRKDVESWVAQRS